MHQSVFTRPESPSGHCGGVRDAVKTLGACIPPTDRKIYHGWLEGEAKLKEKKAAGGESLSGLTACDSATKKRGFTVPTGDPRAKRKLHQLEEEGQMKRKGKAFWGAW